jgi:hypothetical protein
MRAAATAPWPADVVQAVATFKQGDVFGAPPPFSYYGDVVRPLSPFGATTETAQDADGPQQREFDFMEVESEYGVITTQSCDLSEEGVPAQPCFQACPVIRHEVDGSSLPEYLAPLDPPDLPEGNWAADLRLEVPLEKSVLVGRRPIAGFPNEDGYLDFARRLGRRKERPAVSSELVDAVAKTLKRRKSNTPSFKRMMRDHVRAVRLAIDEGPRLNPTIARVHFIGVGPLPDDVRDRLERWWQEEAYPDAEANGINLLPNEYHDGTRMNLNAYEATIPLSV